MAEVIEIPRIKPPGGAEEKASAGSKNDRPKEDEGILVPKIEPGKSNKGRLSSKIKLRFKNDILPGLIARVSLRRENVLSASIHPRQQLRSFGRGILKVANKKLIKAISAAALTAFVIVAIISVLVFRVYKSAMDVQASVENLIKAGQEQSLPKIREELVVTKGALDKLSDAYRAISWMKFIPFLGTYIGDGEHGLNAARYGIEAAEIVVEAIAPYADIIGFTDDSAAEMKAEKTTQDRIDFVLKAIPEIIPKADELAAKVNLIQEEVNEINPTQYPEELAGRKIREKVAGGKEYVSLASKLVSDGKPLLEQMPYILGTEEDRTYLIVFQNDKELRPTGGFITAYSIAKISKGIFEQVQSSDIYNLDNLYTPTVPAPEPIRKYLKGPYLISGNYRLRDMNWSPDFYQSMNLFLNEAEKAGIKDIDGIIAVDTQLLVNILEVVGVIQVPGYGGYSNDIVEVCDCPQVVYELESFADLEGPIVWSENEPGKIVFAPPNYDNRKKIIGPMMNTLLTEVLGQPDEKLPALFKAIMTSLLEKHVLFYMLDEDAQKSVESFGIAGRLEQYPDDYLFINDANLGGRKSNLYVTQEVSQKIDVGPDGSVIKEVTITYKNPMRHDGWLNSVLPNYVRVYVPKGSELLETNGLEEKEDPYEELGKTVFAGFFELRPQGVSRVTLKYKLPFKVDNPSTGSGQGEYKLFIQKQPGTDAPLYTIEIGKQEEELFLKTDKELKFGLQ